MVENPLINRKIFQDNIKPIRTNSDVREFYLLEKLYQAIREDKKRGKRPSAKEFYLMERLYQVMIEDKRRNKKLTNS